VDEGYRLYPSLRLLRGENLFGDIFTAYPPFSYYLHAIAYSLFGVKVSSVRIVLICSQLATTLGAYVLARYLMSRWFALFSAFLTVAYGTIHLNMGYSGWYVVPFLLGVTICLFRWIASDCANKRALLGAGLLAGIAMGIKLRDGSWVTIGCLVAILAVHVVRDFIPGRGKPTLFNPLYAAYLILLVMIVLMLGGNNLSLGRVLLFLLPNLLICTALLIRQLFFTVEIRPRAREIITELSVFSGGVAVLLLFSGP
jgi:4-amino-4-deoxy-L-arabinose transferase-like glycosyltransferase